MNTTENNKLIAEFMGLKPKNIFGYWGISKDHVSVNCKTEAEAFESFCKSTKYHSDWNWLMQVVEKIEISGYYLQIDSIGCIISKNNIDLVTVNSRTKIDAVYTACVEFINWYNKNQ